MCSEGPARIGVTRVVRASRCVFVVHFAVIPLRRLPDRRSATISLSGGRSGLGYPPTRRGSELTDRARDLTSADPINMIPPWVAPVYAISVTTSPRGRSADSGASETATDLQDGPRRLWGGVSRRRARCRPADRSSGHSRRRGTQGLDLVGVRCRAYIAWLIRLRMFPSGSLNHTALRSPAMCTSPSRVVSGRSS